MALPNWLSKLFRGKASVEDSQGELSERKKNASNASKQATQEILDALREDSEGESIANAYDKLADAFKGNYGPTSTTKALGGYLGNSLKRDIELQEDLETTSEALTRSTAKLKEQREEEKGKLSSNILAGIKSAVLVSVMHTASRMIQGIITNWFWAKENQMFNREVEQRTAQTNAARDMGMGGISLTEQQTNEMHAYFSTASSFAEEQHDAMLKESGNLGIGGMLGDWLFGTGKEDMLATKKAEEFSRVTFTQGAK